MTAEKSWSQRISGMYATELVSQSQSMKTIKITHAATCEYHILAVSRWAQASCSRPPRYVWIVTF